MAFGIDDFLIAMGIQVIGSIIGSLATKDSTPRSAEDKFFEDRVKTFKKIARNRELNIGLISRATGIDPSVFRFGGARFGEATGEEAERVGIEAEERREGERARSKTPEELEEIRKENRIILAAAEEAKFEKQREEINIRKAEELGFKPGELGFGEEQSSAELAQKETERKAASIKTGPLIGIEPKSEVPNIGVKSFPIGQPPEQPKKIRGGKKRTRRKKGEENAD